MFVSGTRRRAARECARADAPCLDTTLHAILVLPQTASLHPMKTRFLPLTRPRWSSAVRLFVAVIGLAHVSASDISAQRTLEALLQDTVLDNGLHVIVVPNPTVPLVTIQVTIRNGAFTQLTDADVGTPHLLEHMLFRSFGMDGFGSEAS